MLITWKEVREVEDLFQWMEDHAAADVHCQARCLTFFARRPHLLMPSGFDEYVGFRNRDQYKDFWFGKNKYFGGNTRGASIYRQPSGRWLLLGSGAYACDDCFRFESKETFHYTEPPPDNEEYALLIEAQDLFGALYKCAGDENPTAEERLWSPTLWTPSAQQEQRTILANSVSEILTLVRAERVSLETLSWRVLEDIVAEVLRRSGLDIHVIKERGPQGGRDIVARGYLMPGQEPIQMAVEVKHKAVVDRPEVQAALWQNRRYPALLFVTSGRFTSGVFQEKALAENRLRLFLKDGVALGDLIRDYVALPRPAA